MSWCLIYQYAICFFTASSAQPSYDLKAQLVVTLDEPDNTRRTPPKYNHHNGDREGSLSGNMYNNEKGRPNTAESDTKKDKWQCSTCTYLNKLSLQACEMCGKSKRGPEIQPLTSGGRECPACTLVNTRNATACDACGTSLQHCPTYI